MKKIGGKQLAKVSEFKDPKALFNKCIEILSRMASIGLIHCDYNEFNLMLCKEESIVMIDFPQMISITHPNAKSLFIRDVECILNFFKKSNAKLARLFKNHYLSVKKSSLPFFD